MEVTDATPAADTLSQLRMIRNTVYPWVARNGRASDGWP